MQISCQISFLKCPLFVKIWIYLANPKNIDLQLILPHSRKSLPSLLIKDTAYFIYYRELRNKYLKKMQHFVKEWLYKHHKPGNWQVFKLVSKKRPGCLCQSDLTPFGNKVSGLNSAETTLETLDFVAYRCIHNRYWVTRSFSCNKNRKHSSENSEMPGRKLKTEIKLVLSIFKAKKSTGNITLWDKTAQVYRYFISDMQAHFNRNLKTVNNKEQILDKSSQNKTVEY